MRMRKILCTLICAASVVSTPVMAQSLSPSARIAATSPVKRIAPASKKESKLGDEVDSTTMIIVGVLVLAVVGAVILLGNDDEPSSP